jgi:hypothetical protein
MDVKGNDFVIVRGADPVPLLRSRFPDLFASVAFELEDREPYLAYEAFASYLRGIRTDQIQWARAIEFFNDIAIGDQSLYDLLSVAIFEPLCEDANVSVFLRNNLSPPARALFEEVERQAYGQGDE